MPVNNDLGNGGDVSTTYIVILMFKTISSLMLFGKGIEILVMNDDKVSFLFANACHTLENCTVTTPKMEKLGH